MVKKGKKTKKDVGSAVVGAARGEGADGSGEKFAAEGMGLGALPTKAVGGSGEGITSAEPLGPPARSMLDDEVSQPAVVDPSSGGGPPGGETVTAGLTLEQQGAATQDAFRRDARLQEAAALQDAGDARRTSGQVLSGAAAPGEGAVERTGLGVGHGVFDALYAPPAEDAPMVRFGRGYSDKKRWTEKEAQDWQAAFSSHRDQWGA
jgi:hypothetical protein